MAMSKQLVIQDRDMQLMHFLWNFKVASTAALSAKFFWDQNRAAGYRRLLKLEQYGFVQSIADDTGTSFVWCLDKSGFYALKDDLPPLRQEGYMSEHVRHDLIVSAFQLGNFIIDCPNEISMVTEQFLRRAEFEFYPPLIPRTDLHRPDGYWTVSSGQEKKLIALEVELSDQRTSRYHEIFNFYDRYKDIYRVIWLVPSANKAANMHALFKTSSTSKVDYHNFVCLKDFKSMCWSAKIICGPDTGQMVQNIFCQRPFESPSSLNGLCMLDTRKSPRKS